jgi:hypothetical protein
LCCSPPTPYRVRLCLPCRCWRTAFGPPPEVVALLGARPYDAVLVDARTDPRRFTRFVSVAEIHRTGCAGRGRDQ